MDSEKKLQEQLASGKDGFTARNDSQAYFCNTLALVYIEVRLDLVYRLKFACRTWLQIIILMCKAPIFATAIHSAHVSIGLLRQG